MSSYSCSTLFVSFCCKDRIIISNFQTFQMKDLAVIYFLYIFAFRKLKYGIKELL